MKIIKFTAENVKRLKAIEITPDGTVQVIAGRNAQGKSSVLDAIWLALGGGAAAKGTSRPIRDGEDTATVTLDLGDLIVTRTWKGDKTSLAVTSAEGARFPSPQSMLDGLVGRLSFDPLEFTRRTPVEQRDALLALVELPFDPVTIDAERAALYDERTELGRKRKALGAIPKPDDSLPEDETSAADLLAEISAARQVEQTERDQRAAVNDKARAIRSKTERLDELTAEQAQRQQQIEALTADIATSTSELQEAADAIDVAPEGVAAELESRLAGIEDANAAIRDNNRARALVAEDKALGDAHAHIAKKIKEVDARKEAGLASAVFPVDGLGFGVDGVTYNGVPFAQASSAEQIQVSLAMAMSLNPQLRVIRIMDGSLLDDDSLAVIAEAAEASDYQVWIERVGTDGVGGVVIEDGEVSE